MVQHAPLPWSLHFVLNWGMKIWQSNRHSAIFFMFIIWFWRTQNNQKLWMHHEVQLQILIWWVGNEYSLPFNWFSSFVCNIPGKKSYVSTCPLPCWNGARWNTSLFDLPMNNYKNGLGLDIQSKYKTVKQHRLSYELTCNMIRHSIKC